MVEELRQRYPALESEANLQVFKRKWLYMFVYAEVGYARAYTSLNCWTFTRPVSLGYDSTHFRSDRRAGERA